MTICVCISCFGSTGCDDFATPAELDRPQILGIAADPPAVDLGEATTLSIYVAGPDGEVVAPEVMWEVVSLNPGRVPVGTMDRAAAMPTFVAPTAVAEQPTLAMVQATVATAAGPLLGQKAIVIGPLALSNPTLSVFTAGATDLLTDELRLSRDDVVSLDVAIASDVPEQERDTTYSWYSTVGTIDAYRSLPAELVAPSDPASGWLFIVVRDGRGGIVWRKARVVVE